MELEKHKCKKCKSNTFYAKSNNVGVLLNCSNCGEELVLEY